MNDSNRAQFDQTTLTKDDRKTLLGVACESVAHGLRTRQVMSVVVDEHNESLRTLAATFVTLKRGGELRGCIGMLEATRPLVEDVAHNAYAAAFKDPRFNPLASHELGRLSYHISVLSKPADMQFTDEADLLSQLRPRVDGLILEDPARGVRGTFLPAVWDMIPDAKRFLQQLKIKAGLDADHWSQTIRVSRYTAESIG